MANGLTADDILPLIAELAPGERTRLLRLLANQSDEHDAARYAASPPTLDEFSSDEEQLAWEADGWEQFY